MFKKARNFVATTVIILIIVLMFPFLLTPKPASKGDSYITPSTYEANIQRTNFYPVEGRNSNEVRWKIDFKHPIMSSPIMDQNGNVFFTDNNGDIAVLSALKGLNIFNAHIGPVVFSTPTIHEKKLYVVGGNPRYLYCFNIETAERIFRTPLNYDVHSSLLVNNDIVYFGDDNGNFYAFDVQNDNPDLLWKFTADNGIISSPTLYQSNDKKYVIFGTKSGTLYCLNAENGKSIWTVSLVSKGEIYATPLIYKDHVYIGAENSSGGKFASIDILNGNIEHSYECDGGIKFGATLFAIGNNDYVTFGTDNGEVFVLNATDLEKISAFKCSSSISTPITSDVNGDLYFGTSKGELYAFTYKGNKIFSFDAKGKIDTSVVIGKDGTLYFGDDLGYAYALGYQTGNIVVYTNMEKATFTLVGPVKLQGYGKSYRFFNVPEGKYTITFSDIPGYVTPQKITKFLKPNGNLIFKAEYKPETAPENGTLVIKTNLPNAKFTIEDINGKIVKKGEGKNAEYSLAPGKYIVKFGELDGYITPDKQTIIIKEKETTVVQVEYVKKPNPNPPKPEKKTIVIVLKIGSPYMTVNGHIQEVDPGRGTTPIIVPKWNRTVVPIRAIIEAFGGKILWNAKERSVEITLNDKSVKIWIGKNIALVDGQYKLIDNKNPSVTPIIINDRTMIPIRFVAENLGCSINWNGKTREITIVYTVENGG